MPWLRNEDAALKFKMQGLTVTDATAPEGGRKVPVRYRLPEDELITLKFPCIVLEMLGATRATERQFSADWIGYRLPYSPEGLPTWAPPGATSLDPADSPYRTTSPTALWLNYKVSTFCRLARDHHTALEALLTGPDFLPFRFGYLNVPQDATFRRLDITGGPEMSYASVDMDGNQKRLLRNTWTIRISSEQLAPIIDLRPSEGYPRVTQVNVDLSCYRTFDDLLPADLEETVSIGSSGASASWNTNALAQ